MVARGWNDVFFLIFFQFFLWGKKIVCIFGA